MADKPEKKEDELVQIKQADLTKIMESIAEGERKNADLEAKVAGLAEQTGAADTSEPKLREKKNFEPKFRTVRIRKYPIKGDYDNQGYVVGWTNRGAYQMVDKSGISPQIVDMIDIIFLGAERDAKTGKLQAEAVPLLSLFNKGVQVHCKIIKQERHEVKEPTGEEIDITVYDPKHGMMPTGEKIDGYVGRSDVTYTIQIPGVQGETEIDGIYVN